MKVQNHINRLFQIILFCQLFLNTNNNIFIYLQLLGAAELHRDKNSKCTPVVGSSMVSRLLFNPPLHQEKRGKIVFYGRNSTYGLKKYSEYIGSAFSIQRMLKVVQRQ